MISPLVRARSLAVDRVKGITPLPFRRRLLEERLRLRLLTASSRTVPDFLVIGAQRCGTSSLFKYLSRHPDVGPSLRKETGYFSWRYDRGEAWYRSHFPLAVRSAVHHGHDRFVTFEATPDYLLDPRSPGRAARVLNRPKLIVMLRDPAVRAWSHYQHNRRLGLEPLRFEEAIEAEEARTNEDTERLESDETYEAVALRRFSYVRRGLYAAQIARWFDYFGRDDFLILDTTVFFSSPTEAFAEVVSFLGIRRWVPPSFHNYSYSMGDPSVSQAPNQGEMSILADRFRSADQNLTDLLGRSFSWM